MPTMIQGTRTTANQNTETRRARDVFPAMLAYDQDAAPLTVLMGKLRKKEASIRSSNGLRMSAYRPKTFSAGPSRPGRPR